MCSAMVFIVVLYVEESQKLRQISVPRGLMKAVEDDASKAKPSVILGVKPPDKGVSWKYDRLDWNPPEDAS
jgi:hypothetical protein